MLKKLMQTENNIAGLIARLTLGIVMLPHGLQKLLGMFGGAGFSGTLEGMSASGIPSFIVVLIILGESFGALGLILGFITRFCAASIAIIMLGAVFIVHGKNGFFASDGGIEYHILTLGLALISIIVGGGALSIDRALSAKKNV